MKLYHIVDAGEMPPDELLKAINDAIPGLKWTDEGYGYFGEKALNIKEKRPFGEFVFLMLTVTFIRNGKVSFGVRENSEAPGFNHKDSWTTTYKQAPLKAKEYERKFNAMLDRIKKRFASWGSEVEITK